MKLRQAIATFGADTASQRKLNKQLPEGWRVASVTRFGIWLNTNDGRGALVEPSLAAPKGYTVTVADDLRPRGAGDTNHAQAELLAEALESEWVETP